MPTSSQASPYRALFGPIPGNPPRMTCKPRCAYTEWLYVCVCVCICMHTCMYIWMDGWMDECMCLCMYVYVCVRRCLDTCEFTLPLSQTAEKPIPKGPWNDYLTDADHYKLSADEQLRRKQLLVSKNNILATPSKSTSKPPSSHKSMPPYGKIPSVHAELAYDERTYTQTGKHEHTVAEDDDCSSGDYTDVTSLSLVENTDTPSKTPLRDSRNNRKVKKRNKAKGLITAAQLDDIIQALASISNSMITFQQNTGQTLIPAEVCKITSLR
jgi:hypothetical protein